MLELPLENAAPSRDHGGNLSVAKAEFGGSRGDWMDLSTGINPHPYPLPDFTTEDWNALPDADALADLERAARSFWNIPEQAAVLAAPGASALIAALPALAAPRWVQITKPTYNEHAAAFEARGWKIRVDGPAEARVAVHPNNPDGRLWREEQLTAPLTIIDESFCDVCPAESLIRMACRSGVSAFLKASANSSVGNSAESGMPPAKEIISGWSKSFSNSRISDAFIRAFRLEKIWSNCILALLAWYLVSR